MEITLACCHDRVFHAQLAREFFHGAPSGVGVLDVRFGVQLEELELLVTQPEELPQRSRSRPNQPRLRNAPLP